MSIVIKGFVSNTASKNNILGSTAVFGEMSSYARTFSREITEFGSVEHPGIELNVLHAVNVNTAISPESAYTNLLLEIGDWVYERGILMAGSSSATLQDFIAAFENRFTGSVSGITASPLRSDGNYKMPEMLQFTMTPNSGIVTAVTLWFGNESLETNYDVYSILVVPPVAQLSVFFQSKDAVQTALSARPVDTMMQLVDTIKNKKPSTHITTLTVSWYNISQPSQSLPCIWFLVIYGPKGNNSEAINLAISNYILANSTQTSANWKIVMPDLFRITRFFVLPRWDKYAISPTSIAGIYSPMGKVSEMLTFAQSKLSTLGNTYIANNLETTHHPYRSIQLLSVPGEDNRQGATSLTELIPDYIGQESIAEDFNRQSLYTRQWVSDMGDLLRVAEFYDINFILLSGMRIIEQFGLNCVAMKIKDVEFVVALKSNYAPI